MKISSLVSNLLDDDEGTVVASVHERLDDVGALVVEQLTHGLEAVLMLVQRTSIDGGPQRRETLSNFIFK